MDLAIDTVELLAGQVTYQEACIFFLSDLYSNDKCTEKLKFIFISFVLWVDRGACHHIRGGETGGALEEAAVRCSCGNLKQKTWVN